MSARTFAYLEYKAKRRHGSFKSIDPTPCHASAHPSEHNGSVAFSIQDTESDAQNLVTVSEITTRHLRRLASSASDFLGKKINAAVITVPTNYSDPQREALTRAAQDANIEILQFIHEPVAALLAYDARSEAKIADKIVVVADLGGTRSDVAVIASRGGMYSILATAHDYELGGVQLDEVLVDHFAKELMKKNKTDPRQNTRSLAKLKLEAEATKKALSLGGSAVLSIESLADGVDFSSTINRTRYELLAGKVFSGFTRLIEGAVKKADLDVLDIDEVPTPPIRTSQPPLTNSTVGHNVRRHLPHPEDRPPPAVPLRIHDDDSLPLHRPHSHQPFRPVRPRRRHPILADPGIR